MIRQDTMEQIIRSQQEQIAGLLETNRSLVESNGKLLEQTDALRCNGRYRNCSHR